MILNISCTVYFNSSFILSMYHYWLHTYPLCMFREKVRIPREIQSLDGSLRLLCSTVNWLCKYKIFSFLFAVVYNFFGGRTTTEDDWNKNCLKLMLGDLVCILEELNEGGKVNSVQEAFAKYFAVHLLKFEILQTTWKNKTKSIKLLDLFFVLFEPRNPE